MFQTQYAPAFRPPRPALAPLSQIADVEFGYAHRKPTPHAKLGTLYSSLDPARWEIRLLRIHGSTVFGSALQCSLYHVSLDEHVESFTALSYVWGERSVLEEATVNGRPFKMQPNLAAALRHIRATQAHQVCAAVWADAICINQDDNTEKSQQIKLMGDIYNRATLVIAWMGPEQHDSTLALNAINSASSIVDPQNPAGAVSSFVSIFEWELEDDEPFYNHSQGGRTWIAFRNLHGNSYWSRGWTFQEVLLARRLILMCGLAVLPARKLWTVMGVLGCDKEEYNKALHQYNCFYQGSRSWIHFQLFKFWVERREQFGANHQVSLALLEYAYTTKMLQVHNPRDKVYSILGVSGASQTFEVDYSLPVEKVYAMFCDVCLKAPDGLAFLAFPKPTASFLYRHRTQPPPSWLPNLELLCQPGLKDLPDTDHFYTGWYHSANKLPIQCEITNDLQILQAKGYIIDRVRDILMTSWMQESDIASFVYAYCTRMRAARRDKMPRLQAAARALIGDILDNKVINPNKKAFIQTGAALVRHLRFTFDCLGPEWKARGLKIGLGEVQDLVLDLQLHFLGYDSPWVAEPDNVGFEPEYPKNIPQFFSRIKAIRKSLDQRVMFETSDEHIGHGPRNLRGGDLICILKGGSFPVALRPLGNYYTYLGPCFLLGFMNNEVIEMVDKGEVEETTFRIA